MIGRCMTKIQDWADEKLRRLCRRITPGKRLAVLLTMFLFFSIATVYIFVSGIYNMGKNEAAHRNRAYQTARTAKERQY